MEAKALKKHIRSSPRKMRLVIDLIRGKKATDAINILKLSPQIAARVAEMTLRSAISNLNNKAFDEDQNLSDNDIYVKEILVNQGPTMRRIQPAPMGRAFRIRKRSNHLTIVVATKN
jgi:large subunit ribosomal protein L22